MNSEEVNHVADPQNKIPDMLLPDSPLDYLCFSEFQPFLSNENREDQGKKENNESGEETNTLKNPGNDVSSEMASQIEENFPGIFDPILHINENDTSLGQLIDGCEEARSIQSDEQSPGEVLTGSYEQTFISIDPSDSSDVTIAPSKICQDDLTRNKQEGNENVIVYLNKISEIEEKRWKITLYKKQICYKAISNTRVEERDCTESPNNIKLARRQVAEIEIEEDPHHANIVDTDFTIFCQYCGKQGHGILNCVDFAYEVRSFIEASDAIDVCQYCKESGHGALNCVSLAYKIGNNRQQNFLRGNSSKDNERKTSDKEHLNFNRSSYKRSSEKKYFNQKDVNNIRSKNRPQYICYYCQEPGHMKRNCLKYTSRSGTVIRGSDPCEALHMNPFNESKQNIKNNFDEELIKKFEE